MHGRRANHCPIIAFVANHCLLEPTRPPVIEPSRHMRPTRPNRTRLTLDFSVFEDHEPLSQKDITDILKQWPMEPGKINARVITGRDGTAKIQVRIELGLLQMQRDGNPAGTSHDGFDSLLHMQQERLKRYTRESGTSTGFVLSPDECRALRQEALHYYHRYVALFAMRDFERVARDARHSLEVFDLCRDHAAQPEDQHVLEQFRAQVITMRARAEAELAVAQQKPGMAVDRLGAALEELRDVFDDLGLSDAYEEANEVQLLRGMREALVPKLPVSQHAELEERLRSAIDSENYELAAILRDELRLARARNNPPQQ